MQALRCRGRNACPVGLGLVTGVSPPETAAGNLLQIQKRPPAAIASDNPAEVVEVPVEEPLDTEEDRLSDFARRTRNVRQGPVYEIGRTIPSTIDFNRSNLPKYYHDDIS